MKLPLRILTGIFLFFVLTAARSQAAEENLQNHGICVREANLYLSPDKSSDKLDTIQRGREVAIIDTSRGWLHVLASLGNERDVTGWMLDKGVVRTTTPNGDLIVFGEAVDSEAEAERRHGRKGADQDAQRLYARMAEYFPKSPYAAEAAYRSADIRWQEEREEAFSRSSANEKDPYMRHQIEEDAMKQVIKKFPGTKWADLAAYDLIDNKICGDWQGDPKCPEKEAAIYEKYAAEHPQSPKAAEALYNAAWRESVLVAMYKEREDNKKAQEAQNRAVQLTQKIVQQFPQNDYAPRAERLLYMLQQDIPTYGTSIE